GRLVQRAGEERLEDEPAHPGRRGALERERIQLVEVGDAQRRHEREIAALWCVRIHPLEMREALRIFDVAELRVGMGRPRCRRSEPCQDEDGKPHWTRPGIAERSRRVYGCLGLA